MSSICVGIVKIEKIDGEFKKTIIEFIENSGWGIMFNSDASILYSRKHHENELTFDISDFPNYRNCERLFCPDGCTINDEINRSALNERLTFLQNVIVLCLNFVDNLEMFISGDDNNDINDFSLYEIYPSEFVGLILSLYNEIGPPTVHLFIKKQVD